MKKQILLNAMLYALCALLFSGCIRLSGGAGVWKQGAEDEQPTVHQVGFDTQQLVPNQNQPKVTY